ncbi:G2484-1 protein [Hibiscus syriacus]|uniref:G2484-1 protein n=1 Tax=Hibiscus syriacus TaxID=106335 RepID=A0A6A2ZUG2_HIBSY|nr:G2484-1 protein [Hibiscus syriacus]
MREDCKIKLRKAFEQQVPSLPPLKGMIAVLSGNHENWWEEEEPNGTGEEKLLDSSVHCCQSSLSQTAIFLGRTSPDETLFETVGSCHSQPFSMEHSHFRSCSRDTEQAFRGYNQVHVDIYCKLADPPLVQNSFSFPYSPMSSANAFSPQDHQQLWSPGFRNNSSFDVRLDNIVHLEGLKEFSGPFSSMVEVPWIFRDNQKLGDVELLL